MKKSEAIDAFLAQPALAVVGVSRSEGKFGLLPAPGRPARTRRRLGIDVVSGSAF